MLVHEHCLREFIPSFFCLIFTVRRCSVALLGRRSIWQYRACEKSVRVDIIYSRGVRGAARYIISTMAEFPINQIRTAFPALQDEFIFFDNAAGAQSPRTVLNAVANHLLHRNVQRGGRYKRSLEVDEAIAQARASVALLVNARHPDEISFGMNATSFMRLIT